MRRGLTLDEIQLFHLPPGQLMVLRQGGVVSTVLGSCVAVTMFHRESETAAICHAMLASPGASEVPQVGDERRYRFMELALPAMIDLYRRVGVAGDELEVKVFGGANVIRGIGDNDMLGIGRTTLETTRRLLAEAGLTVAAENTGGRRGRKILFNAGTGEVFHKYLRGEGA